MSGGWWMDLMRTVIASIASVTDAAALLAGTVPGAVVSGSAERGGAGGRGQVGGAGGRGRWAWQVGVAKLHTQSLPLDASPSHAK